MIPKRIRLGGFLCYREEQEIRFDGSSLWMLAGLNGSGKSSIFDAVTYALFNSHRGGSTNAIDLINKDSTTLTVEFDFELQKSLYQIRRTYKRDNKGGGKGTQQINAWQSDSGKWVPIPDTSSAVGFKKWIDDHVGLNYETFTSSVLLRQNHAEKLLEATPSERVKVLSGIVDMDRFSKLHARAEEQRKKARAEQDAVSTQLQSIPEVTDLEWSAACGRIEDAEEQLRLAEEKIDQLRLRETAAIGWVDLCRRQSELQARRTKFQSTLADAEKIEKQYQRLRDLKEIIPPVLVIQAKQQAMQGSLAKTAKLESEKTTCNDRQTKLLRDVDLARKKRDNLRQSIVEQENRVTEISKELPELSGHLARVRIHEEQTARVNQLRHEIDQLPKVSREETEQWETRIDALQALTMAVPVAEQFSRQRGQLHETVVRRTELASELKTITEKGLRTRKTHDETKRLLEEAVEVRGKADEKATAALTRQEDARKALDEFAVMEGSKICRACGQALTASHFLSEQGKRKEALKAAVQVARDTMQAQADARFAEKELQTKFNTLTDDLNKLREQAGERNTEAKALDKNIEQLVGECRSAYSSLPDELRKRIAPAPADDWTTTVWPNAEELRQLKREAGELDEYKRRLTQGRTMLSKLDKLQAELNGAVRQLEETKQTLPKGDPAKLRQRETALKADEQAARSVIVGAKADLNSVEQDLERLAKEIADNQAKMSDIKAAQSGEEIARTGYTDAIERALTQIPESWRAAAKQAGFAEQNRWKAELDSLIYEKVEARHEELAVVRAEREALKREYETITAQIEAVDPAARRKPEEIKQETNAAREVKKEKEADLQKAREERAILERRRDERKQLGESLKGKDQELKCSKILAELLGKDRLQLHLMRTAEKQIVRQANSILDRLSGGQLFLKLALGRDGEGADTALDLEAVNRQTGGEPINVTFLSGSQRFRIAVSLALAIGQYASKQHRPIESVIIDEGFGCLDRNGRAVMIQELQNLRGHLECILLVSHQEEFAEAFPDGYKFELNDGATRVTRF